MVQANHTDVLIIGAGISGIAGGAMGSSVCGSSRDGGIGVGSSGIGASLGGPSGSWFIKISHRWVNAMSCPFCCQPIVLPKGQMRLIRINRA